MVINSTKNNIAFFFQIPLSTSRYWSKKLNDDVIIAATSDREQNLDDTSSISDSCDNVNNENNAEEHTDNYFRDTSSHANISADNSINDNDDDNQDDVGDEHHVYNNDDDNNTNNCSSNNSSYANTLTVNDVYNEDDSIEVRILRLIVIVLVTWMLLRIPTYSHIEYGWTVFSRTFKK